jgi:hypothetical protein
MVAPLPALQPKETTAALNDNYSGSHSSHSAKLAPSVRLSLGHFQCKCSHSPYTFSAKHLKCFAGWALSVQVHEALDT